MIEINTIAEIHAAIGLPAPKHPLVSVFRPEEIKLGNKHAGNSVRLNVYQIWCNDGLIGAHGYGRNTYDFTEGTFAFSKPGQILHVNRKEVSNDSKAWALFFHPDLIRKSKLGENIEQYSYFEYEIHESLHVSEEENLILREIRDKIIREFSKSIDRYSQKLIVANIELLLDYCMRYYDRQFYTRTNLNQDLVSKFQHILRSYYEAENHLESGLPTVKYMGENLNLSPKYLSDLLKKE
ncbi:MAG: AraC family transcriptional regulator, partial [Bacteroidota bacterium]